MKAQKIPQLRQGKVVWVDVQILRYRRRNKRIQALAKQARSVTDSEPLESQEAFWLSPCPRLNGKTPLEALKMRQIGLAQKVLSAAKAFVACK